MATAKKKDAGGRVNPKPEPRRRKRKLKKRAYEFKLARVREACASWRIESPEEAYAYWNSAVATSAWYQENKEHMVVLLLNTRHNIEGHSLVSIGTLNETLTHPREILSPVICGGAFGFILMHNHPSPSPPDKRLTKRISECARLLQVSFLDHVIAGREGAADDGEPFFSFSAKGLL